MGHIEKIEINLAEQQYARQGIVYNDEKGKVRLRFECVSQGFPSVDIVIDSLEKIDHIILLLTNLKKEFTEM